MTHRWLLAGLTLATVASRISMLCASGLAPWPIAVSRRCLAE